MTIFGILRYFFQIFSFFSKEIKFFSNEIKISSNEIKIFPMKSKSPSPTEESCVHHWLQLLIIVCNNQKNHKK